MNTLVDNDVLVKGACYGLLTEFILSISAPPLSCGVLGAARFVVPKSISRKKLQREQVIAQQAFSDFLHEALIVEPTEEEMRFAAELEAAAQDQALNLDTGESQLVAILVTRSVPGLLTGDKRAIIALEHLLETSEGLQPLAGRVHCLEQAVQRLTTTLGDAAVRTAVCSEPRVDKALSICCSCASPESTASLAAGLESYVADLRTSATRVLAT